MAMSVEGAAERDLAAVSPHTLEGKLGVAGLVFSVLAYNAPIAAMAGYVPLVIGYGNGVGAPATFAIVGTLFGVFAIGLTTMARYMKSPGAFYAYIAAGLGRPAGLGGAFIAFTGYTVIGISSYAFAGLITKGMVEGLLNGPVLPWWVWACVLWSAVSTFTFLRIDLSAKVLGFALAAEVLLVVAWQAWVFIDGGPEGIVTTSFLPSSLTSGSMTLALLFGALCITGFEAVAVFRQEAIDPVHTVPRATYLAVLFLTCLYGMGALAYLTAFGPEVAVGTAAADPAGSFAASVDQYLGGVALDLVQLLLVSSAFASLLATQNISSRYLFALGSDGVLPTRLGAVHQRFKSPFVAAGVVAVMTVAGFMTAALVGLDPVSFYARLAGFGAICLLSLMTTTAVAVFVYFRRDRAHRANALQSVVSPVLAFAGLGTILYLAISNVGTVIGGSATEGYIALITAAGIIAAGVVLALLLKVRRPENYARIGQQDM